MNESDHQQNNSTNDEEVIGIQGLLGKIYQDQVSQNHINFDPVQEKVLNHLQDLLEAVTGIGEYKKKSVFKRLLSPAVKNSCESLYIYGGVGRGKSMLMDMFYEACPLAQKRRVHFHAFMLEVHEFSHEWRKAHNGDPLKPFAKKLRENNLLLCFDEFYVTDITDAMILGRLFQELFALGVVIVATSNRHPDDLYKGGLQRERFLPFIELLKAHSKVVELAVKEDYRLAHLHSLTTTYFVPLGDRADNFIRQSYNELTNYAPMVPGAVHAMGRMVSLSAVHGDVALASFEELCERPLGAADYLEIAYEFSTVLVAGIPRLSVEKRNEAKRFVTLIDALYEHKVKLICSADAPPEELYRKGDGSFEFERTYSRLIEMQSEKYLSSEHH